MLGFRYAFWISPQVSPEIAGVGRDPHLTWAKSRCAGVNQRNDPRVGWKLTNDIGQSQNSDSNSQRLSNATLLVKFRLEKEKPSRERRKRAAQRVYLCTGIRA